MLIFIAQVLWGLSSYQMWAYTMLFPLLQYCGVRWTSALLPLLELSNKACNFKIYMLQSLFISDEVVNNKVYV
jgi:hypothetical protein